MHVEKWGGMCDGGRGGCSHLNRRDWKDPRMGTVAKSLRRLLLSTMVFGVDAYFLYQYLVNINR